MSNEFLLMGGLIIPVVVLTVLRINAVMVFLSLCLGTVLVHFVAGNANSLLTLLAPHMTPVSASTLQLGVLALPVVLTCIFMIFSVHGRMKVLLNILPAAGVGFLGVLLAVPLLPPSIRFGVESNFIWLKIADLQAFIVAAAAAVTLVLMWSQRRHKSSHRDER